MDFFTAKRRNRSVSAGICRPRGDAHTAPKGKPAMRKLFLYGATAVALLIGAKTDSKAAAWCAWYGYIDI
jgi:hypothetical protein